MLKNKLNITDEVELSKIEEKITKLKALELYDSGKINTVEVGTFKGLPKFIIIYLVIFMILLEKCERQI